MCAYSVVIRRESHAVSATIIIAKRCVSVLKSQVVLLQTAHSWANAGVVLGARMHREASFFFGVYSWLVKVLGQFSIIYFRGLGLRIGVRVWVRVRVGVRVWIRVRVRVRVRVSVVLWSG